MKTYIIKNDYLTLELSEKGGEPISIKSADGYEYLWCRDAKYWSSSAPVLFPTVGRLRGGEWADGEKIYKMSNHGFARHQLMKAVAMQDFAEFTLRDSAESKECYPYAFTLRRRFKLAKNAILETIMDIWPAETLGVADRGIREGILRSLMARDGHEL
jgi:galactose mutarotase-like enzyme